MNLKLVKHRCGNVLNRICVSNFCLTCLSCLVAYYQLIIKRDQMPSLFRTQIRIVTTKILKPL